MCGIFAAVGRGLSDAAIEHVFRALHHRGPDGRGTFVDEAARLTFVHTRLAVIDLQTGAQPLESEDGNLVLIANGEIYDFERIRSLLEAKGRRFKTRSDSEVIIHLYEEFALDLFEHLRGEFAFLLYDKAKQLLIAARDRFGIKPLYFSRLAGGYAFASEMKALFASGLVRPRLNPAALDPLLDHDPEDARFPFEGIEHVAPATFLTINLSTRESKVTRYWSAEMPAEAAEPMDDSGGSSAPQYADTVLEKLEQAVRLRLRADVPVGLYLSGGIDSAFVGALMERNLTSPLHSFSISFIGSGRDERAFARRAADHLGTHHHELAVTREMLWNHLEDCLWHSELPFVSLAPVGKFLLSKEARQHVTVVLTGEGADEVFLGYRSFFQKAIRESRERPRTGRANSYRIRRLKLPGFAARLSLLIFHKSNRADLAAARARAMIEADRSRPLINAVQEARLAGMPFDILCFLGDRQEMAHSLEARVPFLDHHLYDAAKRIPVDFKIRDGVEKAVLRDAATGILPDDLRLRPKSGFMFTSEAVDLFGADRQAARRFRTYLSKETFDSCRMFSYRAYRVISLLARLPPGKFPFVGRLGMRANKVLMYMMQTHMLHHMFVTDPPWQEPRSQAFRDREQIPAGEPVC